MKIMAIDYGDAHTGIAISDRLETLAGFTTVINTRRQEEVVAQIRTLIAEHGVERLVLGYPKNIGRHPGSPGGKVRRPGGNSQGCHGPASCALG